MTTNIQQGTLLDVLKKKMRQTKEEMEKYKDECEEFQKRLQGEVIRREEVSFYCFQSINQKKKTLFFFNFVISLSTLLHCYVFRKNKKLLLNQKISKNKKKEKCQK